MMVRQQIFSREYNTNHLAKNNCITANMISRESGSQRNISWLCARVLCTRGGTSWNRASNQVRTGNPQAFGVHRPWVFSTSNICRSWEEEASSLSSMFKAGSGEQLVLQRIFGSNRHSTFCLILIQIVHQLLLWARSMGTVGISSASIRDKSGLENISRLFIIAQGTILTRSWN